MSEVRRFPLGQPNSDSLKECLGSPVRKKASPMSMVGFPLLLIPLAIFNIIVFLMPGASLAEPVVRLTLMSGTEWLLTLLALVDFLSGIALRVRRAKQPAAVAATRAVRQPVPVPEPQFDPAPAP